MRNVFELHPASDVNIPFAMETRKLSHRHRGGECGKQIVANGLAAYWVFRLGETILPNSVTISSTESQNYFGKQDRLTGA